MVTSPDACSHSKWNLNWPGAKNNRYICANCGVQAAQDDGGVWHITYNLVPDMPLTHDPQQQAADAVNGYMDGLGDPAKNFPRVTLS